MNERIKELKNQAWTLVSEEERARGELYEAREQWERCDQKFAELIVKKFDDILLLQQLDCIGNHDKKSAELIEQIRDKTKTYFGVEE